MAGTFSIDLNRFAQKTNLKANAVIRRVAFDVFGRIIVKTPVDTGRARANWIPSIGAMANSSTNETDKTGTATRARIKSVGSSFTAGQIMYLTNNLPYIGMLEYGGYGNGPKTAGGFSKQAPAGMVGLSIIEVQANMAGILRGESE